MAVHNHGINDGPGLACPEIMVPGVGRRGACMSTLSSNVGDFERWWFQVAQDEIEAVMPKAIEYGSRELTAMGHDLANSQGRVVSDEEATELAVWFYALGKMHRWSAAVVRGERVSNDTLHDLGVYCRMVQRIRTVGTWPGLYADASKESKK